MKSRQNFNGLTVTGKMAVVPSDAYDPKNPFGALDSAQPFSVPHDRDDSHPDVATLGDLLELEFARELIPKGIPWTHVKILERNEDWGKRELKVAMSVSGRMVVGSLSW